MVSQRPLILPSIYLSQHIDQVDNNNNLLCVISPVGSGESSVYSNLTPILGGGETVSERASTQENKRSKETKTKLNNA